MSKSYLVFTLDGCFCDQATYSQKASSCVTGIIRRSHVSSLLLQHTQSLPPHLTYSPADSCPASSLRLDHPSHHHVHRPVRRLSHRHASHLCHLSCLSPRTQIHRLTTQHHYSLQTSSCHHSRTSRPSFGVCGRVQSRLCLSTHPSIRLCHGRPCVPHGPCGRSLWHLRVRRRTRFPRWLLEGRRLGVL